MSKTKVKLTPPDLKRCQAEKHDGSFMTLGPVHRERCSNRPVVIATEREPAADGQRGSMSLCSDCQKEMLRRLGKAFATFKKIPKLSRRKFYRTVFETEVLSEERLAPNLGLAQILAECDDGPCSGNTTCKSSTMIDGARAAKLLMKQGSDPAFFRLTKKGEDTDEEGEE